MDDSSISCRIKVVHLYCACCVKGAFLSFIFLEKNGRQKKPTHATSDVPVNSVCVLDLSCALLSGPLKIAAIVRQEYLDGNINNVFGFIFYCLMIYSSVIIVIPLAGFIAPNRADVKYLYWIQTVRLVCSSLWDHRNWL